MTIATVHLLTRLALLVSQLEKEAPARRVVCAAAGRVKGTATRFRQRVQLSIGATCAISMRRTGDSIDVLATAAAAATATNLANLPAPLDLPEDLTVQTDHQAHWHNKVGQ